MSDSCSEYAAIITENEKAIRLLRFETKKELMTTRINGAEVEDLFYDLSWLWF